MGPWCSRIWNGSWLSTVFCRPAYSDLWENSVWKGTSKLHAVKQLDLVGYAQLKWRWWCLVGTVPLALQFWSERSVEESAAGGPDQALWKPEEWCQWYQKPQMVCHHGLDSHLWAKGMMLSLQLRSLGTVPEMHDFLYDIHHIWVLHVCFLPCLLRLKVTAAAVVSLIVV